MRISRESRMAFMKVSAGLSWAELSLTAVAGVVGEAASACVPAAAPAALFVSPPAAAPVTLCCVVSNVDDAVPASPG